MQFPATHEQIISQFRDHVRDLPKSKNVVAVIDSIVSNPGVLLPWQELVDICRENGIWSLVDAAHSIGQETGIDLSKSRPDFWVSVSKNPPFCYH